jgi:hypothetical protein
LVISADELAYSLQQLQLQLQTSQQQQRSSSAAEHAGHQ